MSVKCRSSVQYNIERPRVLCRQRVAAVHGGGCWGCRGTTKAGLFLRNHVTCGRRRGQTRMARWERWSATSCQVVCSRSEWTQPLSAQGKHSVDETGFAKIIGFKPLIGKHTTLFNRAAFVKVMKRLLLELPVFCSASAPLLLLTGVGSLCRLLNLYGGKQEDKEQRQTWVTDGLGSVSPSVTNGKRCAYLGGGVRKRVVEAPLESVFL